MRFWAVILVTTWVGCNVSDPISFDGPSVCERDADCSDHGECFQKDGRGVCQCEPFFDGATCDRCVSGRVLVGDACVEDGGMTNNVSTNGSPNNTNTNNSNTNNTTNTNTNNATCSATEIACGGQCCTTGQVCDGGACADLFVGRRCTSAASCGGDPAFCFTQADSGITAGYCSQPCDAQSPCPTGALCNSGGACIAECGPGGTCPRTELECGATGPDPEGCYPSGIGTKAVGESCVSSSECSGGLGGFCHLPFVSGYCSLGCAADDECPMGTHCAGLCLVDCVSASDCRSGYGCFDNDFDGSLECYPLASGQGMVGDPCQSEADCAGGELGRCIQGGSFPDDGYCVLDCTADAATCPTNTFCIEAGVANICLAACTTDADCDRGTTCQDSGAGLVCLAPQP